ncbi:MAG: S-adenosylmethionine decarboxylase proenzyme [Verrucomicrobiales bacterium]|jgi:S-adenosylmethionine decarboxylase proenzyme
MDALGLHVLIECYECDREVLDDPEQIRKAMCDAAEKGNATIVSEAFHQFCPQGVSGVLVIAESHISVHTWPEHGYAAVDIFTCGDRVDVWAIKDHLEAGLASGHTSVMELRRGLLGPGQPHKGEG